MADKKLEKIIVPKQATKYIGLQRLEAQALGSSIHYSKFGEVAYKIYESIPFSKKAYRWYSTSIEPLLWHKKIRLKYSEIMHQEFESIKDYIPNNIDNIMGIGPGVAGLEMYLSNHVNSNDGSAPNLFLVDKTGIDPIHFGFQENAAVYNSLEVAKNLLHINGHPSEKLTIIEADDAVYSKLEDCYDKIDLVTSLIAWGFHFPVSTYIDSVYECLKLNGRLIIDIRKETQGADELFEKFGNKTLIKDDPKFQRLMFEKINT